jgi:hypothetical protein
MLGSVRQQRGPLAVVGEKRGTFAGEGAPATPYSLPWPRGPATAVDTSGATVPTSGSGGRLRRELSNAPIYVQAGTAG